MADGIVTDGVMGGMAKALAARLGRKVQIHRVEYQISRHNKSIKYTLAIEGSHPPAFYGMTSNEIKQRMAMLIDLLRSGVVVAPGVNEVDEPEAAPHKPSDEAY